MIRATWRAKFTLSNRTCGRYVLVDPCKKTKFFTRVFFFLNYALHRQSMTVHRTVMCMGPFYRTGCWRGGGEAPDGSIRNSDISVVLSRCIYTCICVCVCNRRAFWRKWNSIWTRRVVSVEDVFPRSPSEWHVQRGQATGKALISARIAVAVVYLFNTKIQYKTG